MTTKREEQVQALQLTLHGHEIAVLAHFQGNKNILTFAPNYLAQKDQLPVLTMRQLLDDKFGEEPSIRSHQIPPLLSNLLPEGALRDWISSQLKVDKLSEFPILAWTGLDLPGAIVAKPLSPSDVPKWALTAREQVEPIKIPVQRAANKFSLAGVQMKFSMVKQGARYFLDENTAGESWIVKTPSLHQKAVVQNEYSAMKLAEMVGVDIPETKLTELSSLEGLPDIPLPDEKLVYAIKRFDRSENGRIHSEDFAQILDLYPVNKYGKANYEQIATVIYRKGAKGLEDVQQMAKRLLVNILLGNGDAHLKNWSIYYPEQFSARIAPAYDMVSTIAYIDEDRLALNMNRLKDWYQMDLETFKQWANRTDIPWTAIKVHLAEVIDIARNQWPKALKDLPMLKAHKEILVKHWSKLSHDFKII